MKDQDRIPPSSATAERAVLGSILRDNSALDAVYDLVKTTSFHKHAHQLIFQAMLDLRAKRMIADIVTISELLIQRSQIEDIGGVPYIHGLWDQCTTAANAVHYARIVREHYLVRALIHVTTEIQRDAYDHSGPSEEIVFEAERKLLALLDQSHTAEAKSLDMLVNESFAAMDLAGRDGGKPGIATGLADLDKLIRWRPGEIIVVAARPSCGKSALAAHFAAKAAEDGVPAYFASLEQTPKELTDRMLSANASVDHQSIRDGRLNAIEISQLSQAGDYLRTIPLYVEQATGLNLLEISSRMRRAKAKHKIGLAVIDYIQLIKAADERINRQEQIAGFSRGLKLLAGQLEIPILVLAQLNREVESRVGGKPRLADLRESGAIEADADAVILLHDTTGDDHSLLATVDLIVAKNRNGERGACSTYFRRNMVRFEDRPDDTRHFG